ncbi:restriction endonuclease subunit S [Vibrio metschnikovii]|nr:restriction endonuclease subunit S [Vibrio metschnikovii]
MSELPKGWEKSTLGEICSKPQYGYTTKADLNNGIVKFLRTTDITKARLDWDTVPFCMEAPNDLNKYQLVGGDIVIARSGSVGVSYLIDKSYEPAVFASYLIRFKPITPVLSRYVKAFLDSHLFWEQVEINKAGNALQNINAQKLSAISLPLAPIAEQKRIVAKLDEVLAQVDTIKARLDRIPAILKRFRQSVLAAAVSGKLTEEWRAGHEKIDMFEVCNELSKVRQDNYSLACKSAKLKKLKKPRRPSNIDEKIEPHLDALKLIPCFPEEWCKNVLAFITDNYADSIVDGPFGASINVKTDYIEAGVPVIRMVNVRPFKFISENRKFISEEKFSDLERHRIDSGDVLLAKVGATTGDCCIYPKGQPVAMLSTTGSCRITVDKQIYKAEFLTIVLNSYRSIFNSITSQVAQPFLNMKTIKAIPIPIPQVEEQKEIVRLVDQYFAFADTIEAQVKKAQARVDKLTQSILAKAFRGELVAQDPNDEPADKLLERIAKARSEAEQLAKAAKKALKSQR